LSPSCALLDDISAVRWIVIGVPPGTVTRMLLDSAGGQSGMNAKSNPAMPAIERPITEVSLGVMNGKRQCLGHYQRTNDKGRKRRNVRWRRASGI
jgi:hypothetical protein